MEKKTAEQLIEAFERLRDEFIYPPSTRSDEECEKIANDYWRSRAALLSAIGERGAALEEAAVLVENSRLPDAYSESCLEEIANEIRALSTTPSGGSKP